MATKTYKYFDIVSPTVFRITLIVELGQQIFTGILKTNTHIGVIKTLVFLKPFQS